MSEKRSWDIQPKRKAPAQPQPAPQPVRQDRRIPMPAPRFTRKPQRPAQPKPVQRRSEAAPEKAAPIIRREKVKQGRDREPLKARRRRARRRASVILLIVLIIIIAGAFGALWSPLFRIHAVEAAGPDSSGVQTTTMASLTGSYKYVLPRNSIFFFPQDALRTQILNQYPDISAISISRISFDEIAINSVPRESAFLWCGAAYVPDGISTTPLVSLSTSTTPVVAVAPVIPSIPSPCYDADAEGDVYAPDSNTSSDTLRVYDSLASSTSASSSPLGQDVSEANMIPNALQFVKAIKALDVPIIALVIRGDEADLYAQSGTRITYVLGTEEATAEIAESAFPSLSLNDGSLEYVDLRFAGKVYFKKVGASDTGSSATSTYSASVSCYLSGNCKIQ